MNNLDTFIQCVLGLSGIALVWFLVLEISLAVSARRKKDSPGTGKPLNTRRDLSILLLAMGIWAFLFVVYLNNRPHTMADLIQKIENGQIEEAVYLLDRLEQPAVENLVGAYDQSQNAQFRAGIVAVIARVRAPESVAALARLLQHEDVYLQLAAAQALGAIAGQDVVEPLIAALGDPIPDVRAAAVTALCQARDERAIEPLIAALLDPSPQVREAAAAGMEWIDPSRLVEPLIAALKDRSDKVRITAASILIQSGDERAFEPLLDALQSRDLAVIASLPEFYLPYGSDGDEAMWIQALNSYGTKSTAEFYLNSGNQRLAQAAKIWANENGYTIEAGTRPGDNFPAWGKAKQDPDSDQ